MPRTCHFGDFFDGRSARVRRAEFELDDAAGTLVIRLPEEPSRSWRYDEVRRLRDQADRDSLMLMRASDVLGRLHVSDDAAVRAIKARCGHLRRAPPVRGRGKLAVWAAGAVASVAIIIFALVPLMANQLAIFIPAEGERALGDATLQQIRRALSGDTFQAVPFCEDPAGVAALARIENRLTEGTEVAGQLRVHVLDHEMPNAFALPGGHVTFFRGLIDMAEEPEEIAAVFAHEIGHVANRDPTRIALRSAGSIGVVGLLFGDFAGGAAVLFLAERLIQATYTQEAEAQADVFAYASLDRAGVSPAALASLFERMRKEFGDSQGLLAHFTSHPQLVDRIDAARSAPIPQNEAPILTDQEWQALKSICE